MNRLKLEKRIIGNKLMSEIKIGKRDPTEIK